MFVFAICCFLPAFADAAVAPIDFPIAPAFAAPKVSATPVKRNIMRIHRGQVFLSSQGRFVYRNPKPGLCIVLMVSFHLKKGNVIFLWRVCVCACTCTCVRVHMLGAGSGRHKEAGRGHVGGQRGVQRGGAGQHQDAGPRPVQGQRQRGRGLPGTPYRVNEARHPHTLLANSSLANLPFFLRIAVMRTLPHTHCVGSH